MTRTKLDITTCDQCGKEVRVKPVTVGVPLAGWLNVTRLGATISQCPREYDFCSVACLLKFFKKKANA